MATVLKIWASIWAMIASLSLVTRQSEIQKRGLAFQSKQSLESYDRPS